MSHHEYTSFFSLLETNRVKEEVLKAELAQTTTTSRPFRTVLEGELHRLATFVKYQQEGMEQTAKVLFLRANALATESMTSVLECQASLADLQRSTRNTVLDCLALQEFFTVGRKVLVEIASVADKNCKDDEVHYSLLVQESLPEAHLNSSLVCVVSDIYHALRLIEEKIHNHGKAGGETVWEAPSSFQRSTTKYWVKNENLTKLMMICAMEAPLLVYGMKGPLTSTMPRDTIVSEGDKLWNSLATRITSIYFDSKDMSLYKERLARTQGAKLLRVRWYGTTMPTGDKIIFVELKTHHEKWVGNKSVKERASIQEKDMVDFLKPVPWQSKDAEAMVLRAKPNMKAESLAKATDLLLRMHKLVVKHKLTACVRSVYDRAAFQSSKSNDLRLTLDRNVTVVNERVQQPRHDRQWCLTDSEAQLARSCVVPFNVFEVKLAKDGPMPSGLVSAVNDSTIELATKFSKFLTGAAAFNTVPTLPYWAAHSAFYTFFELHRISYTSPASSNTNGTGEQGDYVSMDSSPKGSVSGIFCKEVAIAPKYPARIEPKTYFANERTFIQWVSASILLLSISGFLLRAGHDYGTTAAVISLAALALVAYSTHVYFIRLNLLKVREPYGYFNKVNPIFLASVVGLAVFLIWADSIMGEDILDFFSFSRSEADSTRRLLRSPQFSGRNLHQEYAKCPQAFVETKPLLEEAVSSLVVDSKRHSLLLTSNDSIYIQSLHGDDNDDRKARLKADLLIRINKSHLQGVAMVDDNRLFAVSGGPERTDLIEMAWWKTPNGNEKLHVVGRWTLQDQKSQIDGFNFVSSTTTEDHSMGGSFYINIDSSIQVYSIPEVRNTESEEEDKEDQLPSHPMKLNSLNMKVLNQGMDTTEADNRIMSMVTFEGITFILRSSNITKNVLQAWNLTDGTRLFSNEIKIPIAITAVDNNTMTSSKWTGFALERKKLENNKSEETPNVVGVRGGNDASSSLLLSDTLILHLFTSDNIWSIPVLEHNAIETPNDNKRFLSVVPDDCLITFPMI